MTSTCCTRIVICPLSVNLTALLNRFKKDLPEAQGIPQQLDGQRRVIVDE